MQGGKHFVDILLRYLLKVLRDVYLPDLRLCDGLNETGIFLPERLLEPSNSCYLSTYISSVLLHLCCCSLVP